MNHSVLRSPCALAKAEICCLIALPSSVRLLSASEAPWAATAASLWSSTSIATTVAPKARATCTQ
jgi:hypothetical protein